MELLVPFVFGGAVGALIGVLVARARTAPRRTPPLPAAPARPPEVRHIVLDEGSANVLNALNNRLAAIGALADLLHGSHLDPERSRALALLHGEVRRAAEITQHFLALAEHPAGAAEPSDLGVVLKLILAERDATLRELGVNLVRVGPESLPAVACPASQLSEMLGRLLDFALRRLRDATAPRQLRVEVAEAGPSVAVALWDSGAPLSTEAEQRLVSPFRFTHGGGGGEIEFALARALAQSAGGTLRLRPRGAGAGAEVVVTLPKSLLGAYPAAAAPPPPRLPRLRILLVDDDAVNRQAMELLLQREGHDVVAVENGLEAIERIHARGNGFDVVVTDLQMPRLGGRALYEQLSDERPELAKRFVFVTGDQAREETRRFLEDCGQPTVLKPYDIADLMRAIAAAAARKAR